MIIEKSLKFEVAEKDLPTTLTYVAAEKAVAKLSDGWRIPTREELLLMYEKKEEIGNFCTSDKGGSDCPGWYWSSTESRDGSSYVWVVRFSDGDEGWGHKDNLRLSCRPVRLVPAVGR